MKKRKLRGFVLPSIYILTIIALAITITIFSNNLMNKNEVYSDDLNYTTSVFTEEEITEPVNEEVVNEYPSKPFIGDSVTIQKNFYNDDDSPENQEQSLIYYENTYMQNTGILYASDNVFEVIASIDGKIKEIKKDEILGNVLTIEGLKATCIYYTLGDILVKEGDEVHQNDIIAKSGQSTIDTTKQTLLFEVYINGSLTNPNTFFEKNITELN